MVSEEISGHAALGVLNRQVEVVRAIDRARDLGFRVVRRAGRAAGANRMGHLPSHQAGLERPASRAAPRTAYI